MLEKQNNPLMIILKGKNSTLQAMKHSFFLKTDYKNQSNTFPLYLNLYIHGKRKRIPVNIHIQKKDWNKKNK